MLRASPFVLAFLVSCAPIRGEVVTSAPVDVSSLRTQLAAVIAPEPRGSLRIELAHTSTGRVTIAREPGVSVSVAALDLPDAPMREVDPRVRAASTDGLEVVHLASDGRFEELRRVTHRVARIEQRYAVTLGASLVSLRVVDDHVEALDADGVARLRTEPAFAVDAHGVVRPLTPHLEGDTVSWTADAADLVPPIAIDPAWTATSSLVKARSGSGVFPIAGKKLIVVGGANDATTEIYDVATASFTMGPSLSRVRTTVPVQLDDGRVFVAAGAGESVPAGELYDPAKGTWKTTVASPYPYGRPVVTPLTGARALVIAFGGASIYDAKTDTWTATGNPLVPRNTHRGVLLPDGRAVIVAGIEAATGAYISSAEVFDPATGTFSGAGALSAKRIGYAIVTLADGHVVVAGGGDPESGSVLDSVDVFDPATKTWSAGPKMGTPRSFPGFAVLPDGRLMIAGGIGAAVMLSSTELFDPTAKTWIPAGSLTKPRGTLTLSPVVPGEPRLIAVGGYVGANVRDVDLFDPLALGKSCTGAGECLGGACVDGVCCEKTKCAAGETCGGAASPGHCRKNLGAACATGDECGNGFCVDGVCCDRACDGLCEACDVTVTKGRCTTLAPGEAPHGAHGKCPGEGACTGLCGGVDAKTCTVFPGAAVACATGSCTAGIESLPSFCDGAGKCAAPVTATCEPYACGDNGCKKACAVDADCASGYSCDARSGRCVFGARCDGAHTVLVPGAASIDCTPYRCAGASCLSKCASTDDCIDGTTCDTASSTCVGQAPPSDGGGGCAFSARASTSWPILALLAIAMAARSRRKEER